MTNTSEEGREAHTKPYKYERTQLWTDRRAHMCAHAREYTYKHMCACSSVDYYRRVYAAVCTFPKKIVSVYLCGSTLRLIMPSSYSPTSTLILRRYECRCWRLVLMKKHYCAHPYQWQILGNHSQPKQQQSKKYFNTKRYLFVDTCDESYLSLYYLLVGSGNRSAPRLHIQFNALELF